MCGCCEFLFSQFIVCRWPSEQENCLLSYRTLRVRGLFVTRSRSRSDIIRVGGDMRNSASHVIHSLRTDKTGCCLGDGGKTFAAWWAVASHVGR